MKLLTRPKVVDDGTGRKISEADLKKKQWNQTLTCGDKSRGCGSTLEIGFNDIFKVVISSPMMTQIGYFTHCPVCHEDIHVPHADTPWHHEEVPKKMEWLKIKLKSLVQDLHDECDSGDHNRLHSALLKDGIKAHHLEELDWS